MRAERSYQPEGYFVAIGGRQSLFKSCLHLVDDLRQVSNLTSDSFRICFLANMPLPFLSWFSFLHSWCTQHPLAQHPGVENISLVRGTVNAVSVWLYMASVCALMPGGQRQ